jgi:hypothetical protein
MNRKEIILIGLGAFLVIFMAQFAAIWFANGRSNVAGKFNLSSERIAKDLDGRAVSLMLNQVWPFDVSQNINIQIVGKKQVDEFVVVVVDVKALAPVQQAEIPKEQFSTTTTSKDVPKTSPKLPSKLQLNGRMKLTYELVDNEWYLLGAENLNLRAIPID